MQGFMPLVVQTTVGIEARASCPFRIFTAEESNEGSNILDLAYSGGSWGVIYHGFHILYKLRVTLVPLIYDDIPGQ